MTTLRSLLMTDKPDAPPPHLDRVTPPAAMPGGEVEVHGAHLDPGGARVPHATLGDAPAPVILSRPTRATIQVPEGAITGDLIVHRNGHASNPLNVRFTAPMAGAKAPVAKPADD